MPYYKRFSIGLATSFITTYFFINNLLACDVFIVNFDTYIYTNATLLKARIIIMPH